MSGRSRVAAWLAGYQAAFDALDPVAVSHLFSYPCHVVSDAGDVTVAQVASREAWLPELERLVDAYRVIGVGSAHPLSLDTLELSPRLAHADVHWELRDRVGEAIYEFGAGYTLADLGAGMRVTALAHNEAPRLRAAVERRARSRGRVSRRTPP